MKELEKVIIFETMDESGFLSKLRLGDLDESQYQRLILSIKELEKLTHEDLELSKLIVACLFEVPFEVENTVDYFFSQNPKLGERVENIAENLRDKIHSLLWAGLDKFY